MLQELNKESFYVLLGSTNWLVTGMGTESRRASYKKADPFVRTVLLTPPIIRGAESSLAGILASELQGEFLQHRRGRPSEVVWAYDPSRWPQACEAVAARIGEPLLLAERVLPQTSHESDEWFTPSRYVEAAREVMGDIDLDPASCDQANETVQAGEYYTQDDDGLTQPWHGRVFLNPPYSLKKQFITKLLDEYEAGRTTEAIVLLSNGATETQAFQPLFQFPMCFTNHRIKFITPAGPSKGNVSGSVFVYLGPRPKRFKLVFSTLGNVVHPL